MNRQAHSIAIILLLFFSISASASSVQEHAEKQPAFQPPLSKIRFNLLNSENGLSNNFLSAIAQDDLGFMWFGSRYGLNKFDGKNVTVYTYEPNNPASLSNNYAWNLLVDRSGTLWVVTGGGGLCRYDAMSDSFIRYQHDENDPFSIGSDILWDAYEDHSGIIWVAADGSLNRLDPKTGKFTRYQHDPNNPASISHKTVTSIVEDSSESLWVGTYGGGLNRFDPKTGTFTRYQNDATNPASLGNNKIWSLFIDSRDRLWIGTEGGLDLYNPQTETFTHYKNRENNPRSISHNTVLAIHEDQSGDLWIGTMGGGLNKFDPTRGLFTRYMNRTFDESSLCDNTVYRIYEDRADSMWIATENGINRFDPGSKRFMHYKSIPVDPNSLSSNQVSAIYEDSAGIVWIGTKDSGLNRFDPKKNQFHHYHYQKGTSDTLSSNSITAIDGTGNGILWIGTEGGGLNRFDPQTGKAIRYRHIPGNPNSLSSFTVWDLAIDKEGTLWLGMDGHGLTRFDPEKQNFSHYNSIPHEPNSLVFNWVNSVFADSRGIIWIGTEMGLSRFDPKQHSFQNYFSSQTAVGGEVNNSIYSTFEDSSGTIWIGTNDGLKRLNEADRQITVYRESEGLAGNYVAEILEDHSGILWISTNKGLSRLNPETDTFRNYDKRDGLQSNFFMRGSGIKSQSNILYFGGINGFNSFNPEKMPDNPIVPRVVLTDFQLFNKSVVPGTQCLPQHINSLDQIILTHRQSIFSLEFAALNFRSPEKNQYAYMLKGFESEWNNIGSEHRYAVYTNLDPGTYAFHVKASNNDGLWNKKGRTLLITVLPPWWKTWWAYTSYVLLVIFSVMLFIQWRLRAADFSKRLLEKQVDNRTRQLSESNRNLHLAKTQAETANQAKSEFLANMSHELRTPMNAIIGFSEILDQYVTIPKQRQYLERIIKSGQSLLTLINDILDLSKIEAGKLNLRYGPVSIRNLFEEIQEMFLHKLTQKSLRIELDIAPDIPATLMLDEIRLRQILLNLTGNAVKFTQAGSIMLHAESEVMDHEKTSSVNITIAVSDTGIGIPPEKQGLIFKPFEQQTGKDAARYGGTGLGLSITCRLVDAMGGVISVKSIVGKGSTFTINLPDVEVAAAKTTAEQHQDKFDFESLIFAKATVLIVDDIDFNRDLIKGFFNGYGLDLIEAENGQEAIEKASLHRPGLILLDMKMPVMDGYEASAILKKDEQLKQIPIIAVTASALKQAEDQIRNICDDYLRKPISRAELIRSTMRFLAHKKKPGVLSDKKKLENAFKLSEKDIHAKLATLPSLVIKEIQSTAGAADFDGLHKAIDKIEGCDARLAGLLRSHAEQFEYEDILNILDNIGDNDEARR